MRPAVVLCLLAAAASAACGDTDAEKARATTKPVYDAGTGKLVELTFDRNKNGVIDTWIKMDGRCKVSAVSDTNEDGVIDRWEYYTDCGTLVKVGLLRAKPDLISKASHPDEFVYFNANGQTTRADFIEVSSITGIEGIVRSEFYENNVKVRSTEDTDGDGVTDRWQTYVNGNVRTAEFDTARDGTPKKRFTYDDKGQLVLIESEPDASGHYTKRVVPGKK